MAPLFLLGLYGVFWSVREASLTERVQLGVRYAGVSQSLGNPYAAFSLYSVYAAIDDASPSTATACVPGNSAVVTGTLYSPTQQGIDAFWSPVSTPAPLYTACPSSLAILSTGYSEPSLLQNNFATLSAQAPLNGNYFTRNLFGSGNTTTVVATENFFRSPDVGTLVRCTTAGPAIKASLEPPVPASTAEPTPSSIDTPFPAAGATASPIVSSGQTASCQTSTTTFAAPVSPF